MMIERQQQNKMNQKYPSGVLSPAAAMGSDIVEKLKKDCGARVAVKQIEG